MSFLNYLHVFLEPYLIKSMAIRKRNFSYIRKLGKKKRKTNFDKASVAIALASPSACIFIKLAPSPSSDHVFFLNFVWCSWSDNHPPEDLAKFGYILDIKIKTFKQASVILTTCWNLLQKSGYLYVYIYIYIEKPNMGHFFH
jgi:hypothetical protein